MVEGGSDPERKPAALRIMTGGKGRLSARRELLEVPFVTAADLDLRAKVLARGLRAEKPESEPAQGHLAKRRQRTHLDRGGLRPDSLVRPRGPAQQQSFRIGADSEAQKARRP